MKKGLILSVGLIFILIGLFIGFYPELSNYVNVKNQSYAVESYETYVAEVPKMETDKLFAEAQKFNDELFEIGNIRQAKIKSLNNEFTEYESLLNVYGDGILGAVKIPKIKVEYPIYHGTDRAELNVAVGHLEYTSLPLGTPNSHCAIAGHTALATAKIFTDLDQLEIGDEFFLTVLDKEFRYIVDNIQIVEPEEYDSLNIVEGKEYVTLITCTPPGVGNLRLLVRGERVIE